MALLMFVLTWKAETESYDISQLTQLSAGFPHSSPSPQRTGLHVALSICSHCRPGCLPRPGPVSVWKALVWSPR